MADLLTISHLPWNCRVIVLKIILEHRNMNNCNSDAFHKSEYQIRLIALYAEYVLIELVT